MKKIISLLLCLMLILSLATSAFADDAEATTTVTITTGAPRSVFKLYRVLFATNTGDSYGYSVNHAYDHIYQAMFESNQESVVLDKFDDMATEADARAFAVRLYDAITAYNKAVKDNPQLGLVAVSEDATITLGADGNGQATVPQGYYLIVESQLGSYGENAAGDTYSLYMMDTAGASGLNIESKESVPTLEKKVHESNDSMTDMEHSYWDEHATYDIGDEIEYRIKVTLSGVMEGYKSYYVSVEDTMDPGLRYMDNVSVHVGSAEGPDITSAFTINQDFADANGKKGFKASADLKGVTYQYTANGQQMTGTIDHNSVLIFVYTATLDGVDAFGDSAVVIGANGNKNTAKLIYQNNPYVEIDPEEPDEENLEKTPDDINVVFTFRTIVNKVDQNGAPVTGAGFTLYKLEGNVFKPVGEELKGGSLTEFVFNGLDEGVYKLVETTVPVGRNKADDIEFHIHAEYDDCDPGCLVALKAVTGTGGILGEGTFTPHNNQAQNNGGDAAQQAAHPFLVTLDGTHADVETDIVNRSGVELPSTGGMGTTLIYIAGGILVLAAIVLLVTKKRMSNAE